MNCIGADNPALLVNENLTHVSKLSFLGYQKIQTYAGFSPVHLRMAPMLTDFPTVSRS